MVTWSPDIYREANLPTKRRRIALQRNIAAKYTLSRPNMFNTLRKLPPEVRVMVFDMSLELESHPPSKCANPKESSNVTKKQPALLAALRPDKDIYPETLVIFYNINTLGLDGQTFGRLRYLNTAALQLIKNVTIEAK